MKLAKTFFRSFSIFLLFLDTEKVFSGSVESPKPGMFEKHDFDFCETRENESGERPFEPKEMKWNGMKLADLSEGEKPSLSFLSTAAP